MAGADYGEFIFRNGVYQLDNWRMGAGRVIAEFHKYYPLVTVDGQGQSADDLRVVSDDWDMEGDEYLLEVDGYRLTARQFGVMLDMELIEPDGTIWQGRGGYQFGSGFEDVNGTAEQFYERIKRSRFHWTQVPDHADTGEQNR